MSYHRWRRGGGGEERRGGHWQSTTFTITTTTKHHLLFFVLLVVCYLPISTVVCLTYDIDVDQQQATTTTKTKRTRHSKTKQLTHVTIPEENTTSLEELDPADAATKVLDLIGESVHNRLTKLFEKAKTKECRTKIAEHFGYYINAIGLEKSLPFVDITFPNECPSPPTYDPDHPQPGRHLGMIQNKTYKPKPKPKSTIMMNNNNSTTTTTTDSTNSNSNSSSEHDDDDEVNNISIYKPADEYKFCFGIMTHEHPQDTIRLIESLYEPGHVFVIHVDAKETSKDTYQTLKQYAAEANAKAANDNNNKNNYIHILDHALRVRVNWGGFSMVNATLQMLHYSFENDLVYDKFIHLASTSYPLASNARIRETIAQYPVDANLVHAVLKPSRPKHASWHYFVECDDAVHRIYRLPPLINATASAELYTSSQWFTLSREFAKYLAYPQRGTFVYEYLQYIQHVVVADETFFGTTLLHSPYCDKHHNWNYVHLQFDQWENQIPVEQRDPKKCIMPDPAHCGRSPTTITMDYVDLLTLSDDLFARKFAGPSADDVKDVLDRHRRREQQFYDDKKNDNDKTDKQHSHVRSPGSGGGGSINTQFKGAAARVNTVNTTFEGHGVLIVAKSTSNSTIPLCMGLGPSGNYAKLVPCFYEGVVPSLAEGWETGAVVLEETPHHNRWQLGPCTPDGNLQRLYTAEMEMTPGEYSATGPRCMLTQMDGIREGRCLDGHSNDIEPGGAARVFPCVKRWPQFFSFGNGTVAPRGSMHTNVPQHIVDRIRESRPNEETPQENYLCLGVLNRGDNDEDHLFALVPANEEDGDGDMGELVKEYDDEEFDPDGWLKLEHFKNEEIVATRCSNVGAVIEWLFVPFIVEEEEEQEATENTTIGKTDPESSTEEVQSQPTCTNTTYTDSCPEDNSPSLQQKQEEDDDDVKASL